jgi:hypothetical protein
MPRTKPAPTSRKGGTSELRGFTVFLESALFDRAKRYKTELEIREARKVPWTEILSAALEDHLRKKGA